jgi:hypothetical protein
VTNLDRSLNLIKNVKLSIIAQYPFDDSGLSGYKKKLDDEILAILPKFIDNEAMGKEVIDGITVSGTDGGRISEFTIFPNSPFFPDIKVDKDVRFLLTNIWLEIMIFTNLDKTQYHNLLFGIVDPGEDAKPDITMSFETHDNKPFLRYQIPKNEVEVDYDLNTGRK